MLFWRPSKYTRLPVTLEKRAATERETNTAETSNQDVSNRAFFSWLVVALILTLIFAGEKLTEYQRSTSSKKLCTDPVLRQEWRSVSDRERAEYVTAAMCLHELPSSFDYHPDARLSDDFPWLHTHNPIDHHRTANFLPWHRYFIHKYEKALKERCGYRGNLLYWDWTLDYEDLPKSPVFDAAYGFGGDGGPKDNDSISWGACIETGPLKGYEVKTLGQEIKPHCLSRGFGRAVGGTFTGSSIAPASIREVLVQENYFDFLTKLEESADNDIPLGMGGDWVLASAPNDPLFFLHHTQVDRLWWTWQQGDQGSRVMQYNGKRTVNDSVLSAPAPSLDDRLPPPLSDGITIREMMDTEGVLFCYRY